MNHSFFTGPRLLTVVLVLSFLASAGTMDALAQKSQKTQTAAQKQSTLKDVLIQYQGKDTNLGKLVKVSGDYFTLEDEEGVQTLHPLSVIHTLKIAQTLHPLSVIHTLKIVKPEEGSTVVLEIRLVGKD